MMDERLKELLKEHVEMAAKMKNNLKLIEDMEYSKPDLVKETIDLVDYIVVLTLEIMKYGTGCDECEELLVNLERIRNLLVIELV